MRQEVLDILRTAARRLLLARSAETAAAGAIAAGLSAAALEAAWVVVRLYPAAAWAFCAMPVAFAAWAGASRRLRAAMGLSGPAAAVVVGVCLAAGAAGAAVVAGGWYAAVPRVATPLVLVPLGAAVGAAAAAARGVSLAQAAVYHDLRLGLDERLSTAVQLAGSDQAEGPCARAVYAQALTALRSSGLERRAVWRRTRATAGALALSVVLWATLALLPAWGVVDVRESFRAIAEDAGHMSAERRDDLVAALRTIQEQAQGNEKLLAALRAAVKAAEKNQPAEMSRRLAELGDEALRQGDAEAERIARQLLAAAGLTAPAGGGGSPGARTPASRPVAAATTASAPAGAAGEGPLAARVAVWDNRYAALAVGEANAPPAARAAPARLVPLDDAWAAARERAARAIGRTPPEYRTLVRRFFEVE